MRKNMMMTNFFIHYYKLYWAKLGQMKRIDTPEFNPLKPMKIN